MKVKMRQMFVIIGLLLIAVFLFLPLNASEAAKGTIRFGDFGWDSAQVHNRIAGFIVKHGMGYDLEYIPGDTIMLNTAMLQDDVDINMESWTENIQELYDKMIKSGKVLDLGSNFPDSWQGWLVPTYMIKGDPKRGIKPITPDLKSIADLPKYWEVFKDPEVPTKGRFHNSIPGWKCTEINSKKLKAYGLDKTFNDFITGSDAALTGSMVAAYKKGKPWIGYYWTPTRALTEFDMTPIEEPPFDQKTWDTTKGCSYQSVQVNILINAGLQKRAPDVVEFLKNYETTNAENIEISDFLKGKKGGKSEAAAMWFLREKEASWTKWVSGDIAQKVKAALK